MKGLLKIIDSKLTKVIIFVIISILVINCSEEKVIDKTKIIIPVTIVQIEKSEINIPLISSGTLKSLSETKLSFKTGGIIKGIYVEEGEIVKKGTVLAKINLEEINAKLKQAESAFQKSQRDYRRRTFFEESWI